MIIECSQCERKFRVDDSKIKPPGSRVRCSKCGNVFFVEKKERIKAEDVEEKTAELNLDTDRIATSAGQDSGLDVSAEQSADSSSNGSQQTTEPGLLDQGNKDFVWTISDTDAEAKAQSNDSEFVNIETDSKDQEQKVSFQTPDSPASDPNIDNSAKEKTTEAESSFEWNSIKLDQDTTPEVSAQPESVSIPEPEVSTEQALFSAPRAESETAHQQFDHQPSTVEDTYKTDYEKSQGMEFSAPNLDEKDLELEINKTEMEDQRPIQYEEPAADPFKSNLSVDQNTLSQLKAESYGTSSPEMSDFTAEPAAIKSTYVPKRKGFVSRIGSFFVSLIVGILILIIIISAFLILSINFDMLPKETTTQLRQFLTANLPIKVKDPLSNIQISDVRGKWLSTLNGPIYVLSGNITNNSDNIVNYIKIKSEFTNDGELLYDKSIYAGNTFTDQELQSLPLNDILVKLNRKNGDIDFSDPRKLAGKNYNIMPGESIEFYSVFPSENQILGLKYSIKIIDAEIVEIEQPT